MVNQRMTLRSVWQSSFALLGDFQSSCWIRGVDLERVLGTKDPSSPIHELFSSQLDTKICTGQTKPSLSGGCARVPICAGWADI